MSNVGLATGGTWQPKTTTSRYASGPSSTTVKLRNLLVVVLVAVLVVALASSWRGPGDLVEVEAFAGTGLDVTTGFVGSLELSVALKSALSKSDRAFLSLQTVDERGRAKPRNLGQFSYADRMLACALLGSEQGREKNVLVFGVPPDSAYWAAHHNVVFLEDNAERLAKAREAGLNAYAVRYHTAPLRDWARDPFPDTPEKKHRLRIESSTYSFAGAHASTYWDIIVIDGPDGMHQSSTGRVAPIHHAAKILRKQRRERPRGHVDVLVHDVHRDQELEFSLAHLAPIARFVNYKSAHLSKVAGDPALAQNVPNASTVPAVEFAWFHSP